MLILLEALTRRPQEWRHGYDLIKETGLLSGTLYPLLMRMSDQGLVDAQWSEAVQPGRPPRHMYRLSATGLAVAAESRSNEPVHALRRSLA